LQPEEELVRACASGDPAAWRRLVDLYSGWVMRVARASQRRWSEADVEDACAEVFRQLVERDRAMLRSLRPPYNLRAWLGLITRRTCGKLARRKGLVAEPREVAAPPAPAPFGEMLTKLPPADRLLLELFFVHDCSYEEIASILGISVESVGKQKTRALEKLKALME
jgi:DNA-directed RNA polymerase specialized sigma24 family protein